MTPIKVGFVLPSSSRRPLPSTRVVVLNMLPFLRDANYDPHLVFDPPGTIEEPELGPDFASRLAGEGFRIVFFQKTRGRHVESLAGELRQRGIKTVYGVCDFVDPDMVNVTDVTVAVTEYLKSLYPEQLQPKIRVIHDGIENTSVHKREWGTARGSIVQPLRAVLVTSAHLANLSIDLPPWLQVTVVGRYAPSSRRLLRLRESYWKFANLRGRERWSYAGFLLHPRIRRVAWDEQQVYRDMLDADIGIIPVDRSETIEPTLPVPSWSVKSENRLTMKMAMALPVVATPIPSYEAVMRHGETGFFASTPRKWRACLDALRDPQERRRIGENARAAVLERYSKDEQARQLVGLLKELVNGA